MEGSEDDAAEYREAEWMRNWTPLAVDYGEYDPLRAGSIDGTDTSPHDRGIVRAMRANCKTLDPPNSQRRLSLHALDKPPKNVGSDPDCTLFVGRINHDTTEGKCRYYPVYVAKCVVHQIHCKPSSQSVEKSRVYDWSVISVSERSLVLWLIKTKLAFSNWEIQRICLR